MGWLLVGVALAAGAGDAKACAKAREADTAAAWDRYLLRHVDGACAEEAKARLDVLRAGKGGAALLQTSAPPESELVEASVAEIAIEGPLSIADVEAALRGVKGPLETCFLRELARDPAIPDARLRFTAEVGATGGVVSHAIAIAGAEPTPLEVCVGAEAATARFPAADRPSSLGLVISLARE